jgi:hypothetical protein
MNEIKKLIRSALANGCPWDFYEGAANVEKICLNTVPGLIVCELQRLQVPEKSLGIFCALAAKRSLACWFRYCNDKTPLSVVDKVIEFWFCCPDPLEFGLSEIMTVPVLPSENGQTIRDCRRTDTLSASSAVANCASYALYRTSLSIVTAISHSHIAFETAPDIGVSVFEEWLIEVALKSAVEGRRLSEAELWGGRGPC